MSKEKTKKIRCYKITCKYNGFEKVNCGYCKRDIIYIGLNGGCMDFEPKEIDK